MLLLSIFFLLSGSLCFAFTLRLLITIWNLDQLSGLLWYKPMWRSPCGTKPWYECKGIRRLWSFVLYYCGESCLVVLSCPIFLLGVFSLSIYFGG